MQIHLFFLSIELLTDELSSFSCNSHKESDRYIGLRKSSICFLNYSIRSINYQVSHVSIML